MANASVNQNAASDISHVRDRIRKLLAMATPVLGDHSAQGLATLCKALADAGPGWLGPLLAATVPAHSS